jgi:TonB family protein
VYRNVTDTEFSMRRALLAVTLLALAGCATKSELTAEQRAEYDKWVSAVAAKIRSKSYYPRDPSGPNPLTSAAARVRFSVNASGEIYTPQITQGSGYPLFDAAALFIVLAANPLPTPPAFLFQQERTVELHQSIGFVPPGAPRRLP